MSVTVAEAMSSTNSFVFTTNSSNVTAWFSRPSLCGCAALSFGHGRSLTQNGFGEMYFGSNTRNVHC
eukprot:4783740-Lingulodinium_polyedra.AAC.1